VELRRRAQRGHRPGTMRTLRRQWRLIRFIDLPRTSPMRAAPVGGAGLPCCRSCKTADYGELSVIRVMESAALW
jgi:hypothetical protein